MPRETLALSGMPPRRDGATAASSAEDASGLAAGGVPERASAHCRTIDGADAMDALEDAERHAIEALARVDRLGRELREALITQAVAHEHDAVVFPSCAPDALDLAARYRSDAALVYHRRRAILRLRRPIEDLT